MPQTKRGFTLIELLVVIGIVVILSVVVILTLNPAQLLAQARDSTRISDLATMKSAIALYLADYSVPDLDGSNNIGCSSSAGVIGTCVSGSPARFAGTGGYYTTSTNPNGVAADGWIPVNFAAISSGAPLSALPNDPSNDSTTNMYFYAYKASSTQTYEMNAKLESTRYTTGNTNYPANDGGNGATVYEVGTAQGLSL